MPSDEFETDPNQLPPSTSNPDPTIPIEVRAGDRNLVRLWLPMEGGGVTDGVTRVTSRDLPAGPAILTGHQLGRVVDNGPWPVVGTIELEGSSLRAERINYTLGRPGMYAIISVTAGGKSTLARTLAEAAGVRVHRVGEPELGSTDPSVTDLARVINNAVDGPERIVVIDSLLPLSFVPGAAGSGGISRAVFQACVGIDRFARLRQKGLVCVVNFVTDSSVIERSYEAVKGAATGVWDIRSYKAAAQVATVSWSARPAREETERTLKFSFNNN